MQVMFGVGRLKETAEHRRRTDDHTRTRSRRKSAELPKIYFFC